MGNLKKCSVLIFNIFLLIFFSFLFYSVFENREKKNFLYISILLFLVFSTIIALSKNAAHFFSKNNKRKVIKYHFRLFGVLMTILFVIFGINDFAFITYNNDYSLIDFLKNEYYKSNRDSIPVKTNDSLQVAYNLLIIDKTASLENSIEYTEQRIQHAKSTFGNILKEIKIDSLENINLNNVGLEDLIALRILTQFSKFKNIKKRSICFAKYEGDDNFDYVDKDGDNHSYLQSVSVMPTQYNTTIGKLIIDYFKLKKHPADYSSSYFKIYKEIENRLTNICSLGVENLMNTNVTIISDFVHDDKEKVTLNKLRDLISTLNNLKKVRQIAHIKMPSKSFGKSQQISYDYLRNILKSECSDNGRFYDFDEKDFFNYNDEELNEFILNFTQIPTKSTFIHLTKQSIFNNSFHSNDCEEHRTWYFNENGTNLNELSGDSFINCRYVDFCPKDSEYSNGIKQRFEIIETNQNIPKYFIQLFFGICIMSFLTLLIIAIYYLVSFVAFHSKNEVLFKQYNIPANPFIYFYLIILFGFIFGYYTHLVFIDFEFISLCLRDEGFYIVYLFTLILILLIPTIYYHNIQDERQ